MPTDLIRNGPSRILLVLADPNLDVATILSGLSSHFVLVCPTPPLGVEAVPEFEPDIALIDVRVPNAAALVTALTQAAGGRKIAFVALTNQQGSPGPSPPGFTYSLAMPATAGELEQLIWQICREGTSGAAASAAPPETGMIG